MLQRTNQQMVPFEPVILVVSSAQARNSTEHSAGNNSKANVLLAVQAFPHPLARLNATKDTRMAGYRNYLSYMAVDEFTYTGKLFPPAPDLTQQSQLATQLGTLLVHA